MRWYRGYRNSTDGKGRGFVFLFVAFFFLRVVDFSVVRLLPTARYYSICCIFDLFNSPTRESDSQSNPSLNSIPSYRSVNSTASTDGWNLTVRDINGESSRHRRWKNDRCIKNHHPFAITMHCLRHTQVCICVCIHMCVQHSHYIRFMLCINRSSSVWATHSACHIYPYFIFRYSKHHTADTYNIHQPPIHYFDRPR